jgi:hypothetical protein
MTAQTKKLSNAAITLLTQASQRDDRLVPMLANLPPAARNAVLKRLLRDGLLEEILAHPDHPAIVWRRDEHNTQIAVRITDGGFCAIGREAPTTNSSTEVREFGSSAAPELDPAVDPTCAAQLVMYGMKHDPLRQAASAVVAAWDARAHDEAGHLDALQASIEHLRTMIVEQPKTRKVRVAAVPRQGTKRELVLSLLRRPEGTSGPGIVEATGWAPHTVRAFLTGLKKSGCAIEASKSVSAVKSEADTKRSYSIYRVAGCG